MAAYCHTPRRQAASATSDFYTQSRLLDQQLYSNLGTDLADSSTYIFPHPSSAPPSPSQSPLFSDTSDISLSNISISNYDSPKSSPHLSPDGYFYEHSPPMQHLWTDNQGVSWNLDNPPHLGSMLLGADLQELGSTQADASNMQNSIIPIASNCITKFRHPLARISESTCPTLHLRTDEDQLPRVQLPHSLPRSPVPLLSFFTSLLCIERSTVDLITSPAPPDSSSPTEKHAVEKLFAFTASENRSNAIRQGIRSLDGSPIEDFTLVPFSSFWDIVAGLVLSVRKVLFGLSNGTSETLRKPSPSKILTCFASKFVTLLLRLTLMF